MCQQAKESAARESYISFMCFHTLLVACGVCRLELHRFPLLTLFTEVFTIVAPSKQHTKPQAKKSLLNC